MSDWARENPHRFALEWQAMREHFPGFRYLPTPHPAWVGNLTVRQYRRRFTVAYRYTPRYPDELPKVFVLRPLLPRNSPHVYADASICVHPDHAPPELWTPAVSVALCQAWLFKFCCWQAAGVRW